MHRRYAVSMFALLACAAAPNGVTLPPAATAAVASPDLHVGDVVVYRFSGSFTREPVLLREEVSALDGARATIDVRATRGHEERRWMQIGPADREARWNNATEAIEIVREAGRERLPNPDDATLARLYEWILYPAEGEPTGVARAACEEKIGSATLACTCERATRGAIRTEQSRCSGFAWQRGPARWTNAAGEVVWQAEVVASTVAAK